MKTSSAVLATAVAWTSLVNAQSTYSSLTSSYAPLASCSSSLTAKYAAPSVAPGYVARLVAQDLSRPRGIKFDNEGNLLVVEQDKGIAALTLVESGAGCWSVSSRRMVIDEPSLNHGIELSADGNTLYASSGETLWSWAYSSSSQTNTSAPRALVTGMAGSDHTSRTLLLSKKAPGLMVINRGSNSNIDPEASSITTGHSQVKAFNLTNATDGPYDFNTDGLLLGWGLRNDVGMDEEPLHGGIYSVENSADQISRDGVDIHRDNPAEELNFLGYLNGTSSANQGRNFGYPECFTAWNTSAIPRFAGTVGQQFAIDASNATLNDTLCDRSHRQPAVLAFQAHTAPLDLLFNPGGTTAWITFHGSWNRESPVGYKVSAVGFAGGAPTSRLEDSVSATVDVVSNPDLAACPGACFRPVGLAWDPQGRLFLSSDATGEIYVVLRTDGVPVALGPTPVRSADGTSGTGGAGTTTRPSPSSTNLAASVGASGVLAVGFAVLAFWL